MNFPKFLESKGILKIGRSEVCVWGGGAEGRTLKSRLRVYIYQALKSLHNYFIFKINIYS